jgi:hypothetical protein
LLKMNPSASRSFDNTSDEVTAEEFGKKPEVGQTAKAAVKITVTNLDEVASGLTKLFSGNK